MSKNPNKKIVTNNPTNKSSKKVVAKSKFVRPPATPAKKKSRPLPKRMNPFLAAEIKRNSMESLPKDGSWIPAFLRIMKDGTPSVVAARSAGVSRSAAYEYAEHHPEFRMQWIRAERDGVEWMENILRKRAASASDYALLAYLKARDERYREKVQFEIVRKYIGDFAVQMTHTIKDNLPDACPHCKTNLDLKPKIAEKLRELSAKIGEKI